MDPINRDPIHIWLTFLFLFSMLLEREKILKKKKNLRATIAYLPNYFTKMYLKSVFNTLRATAKFYTVSKRILPATRAQFSTEASRISGKFDAPTPLPSQAQPTEHSRWSIVGIEDANRSFFSRFHFLCPNVMLYSYIYTHVNLISLVTG